MKKEFKIGLTIFASFAILVWGINFLKGRDLLLISGEKYYGIYSRLEGLTEASPIYYHGFKIGSVRNIEFHPTKKEQFLVTFSLNKEVEIPIDSRAQIYSLDLMGSKGVQFVKGTSEKYLMDGDTIPTSVMGDLKDQVSMEVLPLKDKAEKLIVRLDSVLADVGSLFTEENKANLAQSIERFNRSMNNLERLSAHLANKMEDDGDVSMMLKRMDSVLVMLASQSPHLDTTFTNLAAFSGQLKDSHLDESFVSLKNTLDHSSELLKTLNSGEGSLGLLLTDKELYYSLTDVSANMNRLLMDLRHNPDRYVNFSAVNLGRKVYVSDDAYGIKGIYYQVVIKESKTPIDLDSIQVNSKHRIFEDYRNSRYFYSIGQVKKYDEILTILDEVKPTYEESKIVAFENGKEIKVNKARKKTD